MPSNNDSVWGKNVSRRKLLQNTAAFGALPATVGQVGASSNRKPAGIEDVLHNRNVRKLIRNIPGLDLNLKKARVFGNRSSVVVIPGNFGKLVLSASNSMHEESENGLSVSNTGETVASFYFSRWVPGVDDAWPSGTKARLTSSDNGVLLERNATESEKQRLLKNINSRAFTSSNTNVTIIPDENIIHFLHKSSQERKIQSIHAVYREVDSKQPRREGLNSTDKDKFRLEVINENTYSGSIGVTSSGISTEASCNDQIMIDLVWCLIDHTDCALCAIGSPAPMVLGACIIIVCFDGGVGYVVDYLSDFGCFTGAERGADCFEQLIDEYGDDIPEPPDLPDPDPPDIPFI